MKNILLYDMDGKIPNLALMKLSTWHKSQGNRVSLNKPRGFPDYVYISCLYRKNRPKVMGISKMFDCPVFTGGTGIRVDSRLAGHVEFLKPDYELYPSEYSQGFCTRGCIRQCEFCVVPRKEGGLVHHQYPSEFHDDRFSSIMYLDNNLLASKRWKTYLDFPIEQGLTLLEGGFDFRVLTPEKAGVLADLKTGGSEGYYHFAFDNMGDEKAVRRGIGLMGDAGVKPRRLMVYVLVGFNTTQTEDLFRLELLRKLGANPFVMKYQETPYTRQLARWVNRKWFFKGCTWEQWKKTYDVVV